MPTDVGFLRELIRDVPDFPEPGITFRDITPLLADVDAFRFAVDALCDHFAGENVDRVVGIEARGFILGAAVAYRFGAGFVPVRKPGKLPWRTTGLEYALEYGTDRLEVHVDSVGPEHSVLIVDDVLATGGTAETTVRLVEGQGARVLGMAFLLELCALGGRGRLGGQDVMSLIPYS
ncbi:MAG: adenine phosphoribosyltransferase [Acidimicrobiales bacterium]|nr:adenine phosphoribosyltransferase [Acidimicrobiales bacterium]